MSESVENKMILEDVDLSKIKGYEKDGMVGENIFIRYSPVRTHTHT